MSLIAETSNPLLEQALHTKLQRRHDWAGGMGELEPVAVRLGLLQNSLKPRFRDPHLVLFAADHGLAVEGLHGTATAEHQHTDQQVQQALAGQLPVAVFARQVGLSLAVVDCGVASPLPAHEHMLQRKIAHGTRNARVSHAMSVDQAHAAIRAGMEIADAIPGNMVACAGLGIGSDEAAALLLSRLTQTPLRELLHSSAQIDATLLQHQHAVLNAALARHREVADPVELLAAFGGFETAVMVGMMLVAASKRHLLLIDGMSACAALMVASRISPPVTDYCVFCRSRRHAGVDRALQLFQASALLDLGLDTTDGTGACLAWPMVRAAAAMLSEVGDDHEPSGHGALFETPATRPGPLY